MNRSQRYCILAGFALVLLAGLFPPWYYHCNAIVSVKRGIVVDRVNERQLGGYYLIFAPPPKRTSSIQTIYFGERITKRWEPCIDFTRLALLWILIGTLTVGTVVACSGIRMSGEG